jgi:hypothetical protein
MIFINKHWSDTYESGQKLIIGISSKSSSSPNLLCLSWSLLWILFSVILTCINKWILLQCCGSLVKFNSWYVSPSWYHLAKFQSHLSQFIPNLIASFHWYIVYHSNIYNLKWSICSKLLYWSQSACQNGIKSLLNTFSPMSMNIFYIDSSFKWYFITFYQSIEMFLIMVHCLWSIVCIMDTMFAMKFVKSYFKFFLLISSTSHYIHLFSYDLYCLLTMEWVFIAWE